MIPDYRKINELLSKVNDINGKLIDLNDSRSDQTCELNALVEKDIWLVDHHGKEIVKISEKMDAELDILLTQLDDIRTHVIKAKKANNFNKSCGR